MPPKIIARNADRQGGVLPVSGAARAAPGKTAASRLKLEIRRLPPGLTLPEFEEILGDEWRLGKGRIDWREYRQGKTRAAGSGKVPEQSRCYIHVVSEPYVKELEKRFLEVVFHDKAGTHKNPDLKNLQPNIQYAPNQRTPLQQAKQRADTRQGTIDQDPEFIAFLEAETQPIVKPSALDAANAERDLEKAEPKTTPLIEDLREKKANKAKAAQAKAEKAEKDKKSQTIKTTSKDVNPSTDKDASKGGPQQKAEQPAKDSAKALNKQVAGKPQPAQQVKATSPAKSKKQQPSPKPQSIVSAQSATAAASGPPSPAPQRAPPSQRQRGNADGIKKMLQKDLGIRPKPQQVTQADAASTSSQASPSPAPSIATTQPVAVPTAPKAFPNKAPSAQAQASLAEPKTSAVKAYLKHANPSQGMTEILIQQALSQYGELMHVTIDPRKGTAIAMFKQNEGLKKALDAKRVPVANGAVEVLEFRERPTGGPSGRGSFRGGRGGRGGGRGGAQSITVGTAAPSAAP